MTVTVRPVGKNHQSFSALWRFEQGQLIFRNAGADYCGLPDDNLPTGLKRTNLDSSHRLDDAACPIPPTPHFIVHCDLFSINASTLASQRKRSIEGMNHLYHVNLRAWG